MDAKIVIKELNAEFPATILPDSIEIVINEKDLDQILANMTLCPYRQNRFSRQENTVVSTGWWTGKIARQLEGRREDNNLIFPINQIGAFFTTVSHNKAFIFVDNIQLGYWQHYLEDVEKKARWAKEAEAKTKKD